ncbi:hypothetical protein ACIQGZ_12575 [Streptomyces sp. NPDC092296]|uniref:hypothetical protein n=1 Tax=Streptomyces sp. NPDC092296 TaxID=3366012 RepID=UPI0038267E73
MEDTRNRAPHLTLVGSAGVHPGRLTGFGLPLPRRHRRQLAAAGIAAALLLCGLSTGTAVQALHGTADASAAAPAAR